MVDANADVEAGCAGATSQTDRRFIIAIDYGTTNSSASYAIVSNDTQDLSRGNVRTISNFPAGPFRDPRRRLDQQILSDEVPSEVWYPEEEIKHQLGLDDFVIGEEDAQELEVGEQEQESDSLNGQATGQNKRKAKTYWRTHPANVRWGFEARPSHALSAASDFLNHRNSTVKWAKLQLADPDAYQKKGYPPQTRKAFNTLRYHGIVRKELDFITDFLTCFLKHIKQELQMAHGLREDESVEMVLCVPVCWSCKARRDMQAATIVAMKNAGLGTSESLYNMFMVTEPEAAAAYVLDDKYDLIKYDDNFILLDAGGGTVDAITYNVTNTEPLRLKKEVVDPNGDLCGSNYLNVDFREFVKEKKLFDQRYLEDPDVGLTLIDIIDQRVIKEFENRAKREMHFGPPDLANTYVFDVPRLKPNLERNFRLWQMVIKRDEFYGVFKPRMEQVGTLLLKQLHKCHDANVEVNKVVITGGYADNPALRDHLDAILEERSRISGPKLDLLKTPGFGQSANAVSAGAVLRAFKKEDGPTRKLQSSYGLIRKEPLNRDYEGHRRGQKTWDDLEATYFVKDTILWKFVKDEIVSSTPKTKVINTEWTFRPNRPCIVREEFYVSDTCTESHWQLNSPRNKGKVELVGTFTLNLTPWRDDGRMQLRKPAEGEPGKEHYVVQFDIVMELVGRTIRCRAHHPSSGAEGEENGEVTGEMLPHSYVDVSIAAAFEPGTQ